MGHRDELQAAIARGDALERATRDLEKRLQSTGAQELMAGLRDELQSAITRIETLERTVRDLEQAPPVGGCRRRIQPLRRTSAASRVPAVSRGLAVPVFVVANGHPYGDAYTRSVRIEGGQATLVENGQLVVVFNALRVARYRGAPKDRAASALRVFRHEQFHILFDAYRRNDARWKGHLFKTPAERLQLIVLDEGLAHFAGRAAQGDMARVPTTRAIRAFDELDAAFNKLAKQTDSGSIEVLLRRSNMGAFWDKYGAVAGWAMAQEVSRVFGIEGLKQAVRCGPGRLRALYRQATAPERGTALVQTRLSGGSWVDLCSK